MIGDPSSSISYFGSHLCPNVTCGYSAQSREALILHLRSHFEYENTSRNSMVPREPTRFSYENGEYRCLQCNKSTSLRLAFVEHIRHHTCKFPYQCGVCLDMINSIPEYRIHVQDRHPNIVRRIDKFLLVKGEESVTSILSLLNSVSSTGASETVVKKKRATGSILKKAPAVSKENECNILVTDIRSVTDNETTVPSPASDASMVKAKKSVRFDENSILGRKTSDILDKDLSKSSVSDAPQNENIKSLKTPLGETNSTSDDASIMNAIASSSSGWSKFRFVNGHFLCYACSAQEFEEAEFRLHLWGHVHNSALNRYAQDSQSKGIISAIIESLIDLCKLGWSSIGSEKNSVPSENSNTSPCLKPNIKSDNVKSNDTVSDGISNSISDNISDSSRMVSLGIDTVEKKFSPIGNNGKPRVLGQIISDNTTGAALTTNSKDLSNALIKKEFGSFDSNRNTEPSISEVITDVTGNASHKPIPISLPLQKSLDSSGSSSGVINTQQGFTLSNKAIDQEEMISIRYDRKVLKSQCNNCTYTCNNASLLASHREYCKKINQAKNNLEYTCTECKFTTKWKESLTWHMEHHTNERTLSFFKCSICGRDSSHKSVLEKHVSSNIHGGDPNCKIIVYSESYTYLESIRRCPLCSDAFSWAVCLDKEKNLYQRMFIDHLKDTHKLEPLTNYLNEKYGSDCNICPEEISFPKRLLTEVAEAPTLKKLPTASSINNTTSFDSKSKQNVPLKSDRNTQLSEGKGQNPVSIDTYHCEDCPFSAASYEAFSQHQCGGISRQNSTSEQYKRIISDVVDASITSSEESLTTTSDGVSKDMADSERKQCSICVFYSFNKLVYNQHMKDHELYDSIKNGFKCGMCNFSHAKLVKVKEHVKKFHTNIEKPFIWTLPGRRRIALDDEMPKVSKSTDVDKPEQDSFKHNRINKTKCKAPLRKTSFPSATASSKSSSDSDMQNAPTAGSLLLKSLPQVGSGLSFGLWDKPLCGTSSADKPLDDIPVIDAIDGKRSTTRKDDSEGSNNIENEANKADTQSNSAKKVMYRCIYCKYFEPTHLLKVVKHHILISHLKRNIYQCPFNGCTSAGTDGSGSVIVAHANEVHNMNYTISECLAPELDSMQAIENVSGTITMAFFSKSGAPVLNVYGLKSYLGDGTSTEISDDASACKTGKGKGSKNRNRKRKTSIESSSSSIVHDSDDDSIECLGADKKMGSKMDTESVTSKSKMSKEAASKKWWEQHTDESDKNEKSTNQTKIRTNLDVSSKSLKEAFSRLQTMTQTLSSKNPSDHKPADVKRAESPGAYSLVSSSSSTSTNSAKRQKLSNSKETTSLNHETSYKSGKSSKLPSSKSSKSKKGSSSEAKFKSELIDSDSDLGAADSKAFADIVNQPDSRDKLLDLPKEVLTKIIRTSIKSLHQSGESEKLRSIIDDHLKNSRDNNVHELMEFKSILDADALDEESEKRSDSGRKSSGSKTSKTGKGGSEKSSEKGSKRRGVFEDMSYDSDQTSNASIRSTASYKKSSKTKTENSTGKKLKGKQTGGKGTAMKTTAAKSNIYASTCHREIMYDRRNAPSPCSSTYSESSTVKSRTSLNLCCHLCTYRTDSYDHYTQHMKAEFKKNSSTSEGGSSNQGGKSWEPVRHLCGFCSYSTYIEEEFEEHRRCHTLVKPFQCGYCNFTGFNPSNVKRHSKSVHGEKPVRVLKAQDTRICDGSLGSKSSTGGHCVKRTNVGVDLEPTVVVRDVTKLSQRNIKMMLFRYDVSRIDLHVDVD